MYLSDKGLRLANTRIIIKKKEQPPPPQPTSSELFDMLLKTSNINRRVAYRAKCRKNNKGLHPSIIDIYKNNPTFKLPKKCLHRDVAPTVSLGMDEVESYFRTRKLDMYKYIYKPSALKIRQVARKRTSVRFKAAKEVKILSAVDEIKESILKDWDDVGDDMLKVSHVVSLNPGPTKNDDSVASSSTNTTKPAFIESLGLTPSTSLAKFPSILICKICNTAQNNVASLKKHHSRHRVCEFCKIKLKSVEKKNNHVQQCEVKRILENPAPIVYLDKVERDLNIRKRYRETFVDFNLIPGLEKPSTSKVIVIEDDEETATESSNDVIEVKSKDAVTLVAPTSSSVVRPIIGICNDSVLEKSSPTELTPEQKVVKSIVSMVSKLCRLEAGVQTEIENHPPIIKAEGICTLKNFKSNLLSYSVPVKISYGNYNVTYISSETNQIKDKSGLWNNLELVEKRIKKPPKAELSLMNTTYPLTFVQSSQLSVSSIQLMTTTPTMSIFLPNHSAILQGAGLSLQPSQTINNAIFNPLGNASIQTTPLLQNYTLSMGPLPVISNPTASSSKTSPNVADPKAGCSTEGQSEASASSSRRVSKAETRKRSKRPFIKVKIGKMPKSSRRSKLRVKNIWELK